MNNGEIILSIAVNHAKKTPEHIYAKLSIKPANGDIAGTIERELHYGLFILGTEKHESRRIDNQLRGRA